MLITDGNAVFISSLLDPHAEHLVDLLMKSQSPEELGYLNFFLGHFGERNSWEQFCYFNVYLFSFLVVFWGGTVLRFPYRAGT